MDQINAVIFDKYGVLVVDIAINPTGRLNLLKHF